MRENKFKVWDIEEKCWIPKDVCYLNPDGVLFTIDEGNECLLEETIKLSIVFYTGLKDKNGVEIYGDSDLLTDDEGRVLMLKWINKWAGYGIFFFDCNEWSHIFDPIDLYSEEDDCLKLLLIGNIYENPELLNDK